MPNRNGKTILVTQEFSRSTAYADIDVAIDPESRDIVEKPAEIVTTLGKLFTVQPFNNGLVKMELTGDQIVQLLNQQWAGQPFARVLKTSGISYAWQENDPAVFSDNVVLPASIMVNGQPLDSTLSYTVTVNSFLAAGGDNFSILPQGTGRVIGPVDLDALVSYLETLPQPFSVDIEGRIQTLP